MFGDGALAQKTTELHPPNEKPLRRSLRVALYPYVPQKAEMYWQLEQMFEDKFSEIDLRFVDLGDYYDGQMVKNLIDGKVDVIEVDTIFLRDLVDKKLIADLPPSVLESTGTFLPVAEKAARLDGKIYGVPHWVCGNFMFFRADDPERNRLRNVRSLDSLERIIGRPLDPGQSVLSDFKGKSTLGEKYLDALLDVYQDEEQLMDRLAADEPDTKALQGLSRLFALCPGGLCDSQKHHNTAYYAKQFAHRKARVFIGYSERLFFVADEYLNGVREDEPAVGVVGKSDIDIAPAPLAVTDTSKNGTISLAWVDVLSVSKSCKGEARRDAENLIKFFNDEEFTKCLLIPARGQAPRYLLPARSSLYGAPDLLAVAPLYTSFFEIMTNSISVTAPGLNEKLRSIGEFIDSKGFSPLNR